MAHISLINLNMLYLCHMDSIEREHGFYAQRDESDTTESCGAHSPRVEADPRREILTEALNKIGPAK